MSSTVTMGAMANVVIIGGGPGGYEAAMVAAQLGGSVTLIEDEGMGGSAVGAAAPVKPQPVQE